MAENSTEEKIPARVYEVAYLLNPNIGEEKIGEEINRIKSALERRGAFIISDEFPRFRQLAYEMVKPLGGHNEKYTSAYFGWVKFEIGAEAAIAVKTDFDQDPQIIRFLITKTERESQPAPKVFVRRERPLRVTPKVEGKAPGSAMTEAEIDKTIEELLVE